MSHVEKYCFIRGEGIEDAVRRAQNALDEMRSCGKFHDYEIVNDGTGNVVKPVKDIPLSTWKDLRSKQEDLLEDLRDKIAKRTLDTNIFVEARLYRMASDLIYEDICAGMPYYDLEDGCYYVPTNRAEPRWAVLVRFYF
jgi:hypothetical protein